MEERGFCREKDFQEPFYGRCMRLRAFVNTANEELYAWRNRRRFRVRLMQSKELFCKQFRQTSRLLQETAAELGGEWMADSNGIAAVKRVLRSSGINAAVAVQRSSQGRRVIELTGQELSQLAAAEGRRRLSHAVGIPLETGELTRTAQGQRLRFRESPRLAARVGAAARPRDGESVSGDNGSWFKDSKGCLWVVLCDGMGAGSGAAAESRLVLRLLEGGTYRLLQELSLGPVPESDPGTGGYHTLTIRDGFAVVLWEDQLTVLSRTEEGYHLDYTCPTQTAYVTGYTVSFTDPEPEKQGDEDAMPYTVAPNFAMAYQDGKLAVAAYVGNSSMVCVLLLEVYGPEGLLYATARVPSVERQFAADNVRPMWVREDKKAPFPEADISTPIPELTWEK